MKKLTLLAICTFLLVPFSVGRALALTPSERLVYDVSWTGVKAATAVQEVTTKGNDVHIVSTTRSADRGRFL